LKTLEYPRAGTDPSELLFETGKVIGTSVKVMRTGQTEADVGWHIAEIYYKSAKKNRKQTYVKVLKPGRDRSRKGLQKILPLQSLEKINPEIRLLLYESEKDYVLYEDKEHGFKIGLIIDKSTDPRKLEKTFHGEVKKRKAGAPVPEAVQPKQRVGERKNLIYYLKVTDTESGLPIGHAVDISKRGFMLTASTPIEPQVGFQLRLLLPTEMKGSWHLGFSATSRWCQPDENPDYYNVGFQFNAITPDGAKIIGQLIEDYCF